MTDDQRIELHVRLSDLRFGDTYDVFGMNLARTVAVSDLTFVDRAEGTRIQPFMRLEKTEAQGLLDSLWACGLRPSTGDGNVGALAATTRHLEDMRTLVFKGITP